MIDLPRRRDVIGTRVSITNYAEVLDVIAAAIDARERIFVCCAPASSLTYARRDPELRAALDAAGIVTPDGMGVVYAARVLGETIDDRVYGPDLMEMACARAAERGWRIWLYGGYDDAALAQLESELRRRHPALEIAGGESPPHRPLGRAEAAAAAARINAGRPDIVWVGLGSPKQEIWMHEMREHLGAPVLCGVGAAFDFHAGRVAQAPGWMQRHGLEWLFRTIQEPARLGRRYLVTLPHFIALVARQRIRG